jgi:hypothetical protein
MDNILTGKYMDEKIKKQRILALKFATPIYQTEIVGFRGAINQILSTDTNVLFHNHEGDSFRYSYPLIQYKRINKNAALVCINEGTEAVGLLLNKGTFECTLGDRKVKLEIDSVKANQHLIQTWHSSFTYYLRKWLPLNQGYYSEYQKLEGIAEKCQSLERILTGNILSLGKGLGIHFDKEIKCKITEIIDSKLIRHKNVKMQAFDIVFKSNVSLPDYIGLGKGASTGFGVVARKREKRI